MKESLMPHNAHPTRRTILTGAAWALPIIVASALVPAYAANGAQTHTSPPAHDQRTGKRSQDLHRPGGHTRTQLHRTAARIQLCINPVCGLEWVRGSLAD